MRFFAKEIFIPIHFAFWRSRRVHRVKRAYAKHLSRPFAIIGGDDWRVNPKESVVMKVAMSSHGHGVANSSHRAKSICARAQVRHLAQIFIRVRLGLNWICIWVIHKSVHAN